jgi:hypothetical protein
MAAVVVGACGQTSKAALSSSSSSAPAPATSTIVPGVPTLGQPVGIFFDGQGFGQVRPTTVFNGGDPTGDVTVVSWNSWGGPTAVGKGTNDWVGPNQSVAGGTEEPVTIVAFDRETCADKPMYGAVEWYYPEHGERFDPKHYEDICTGQYVDLGCLSYIQASAILQVRLGNRADVASEVTCDGASWADANIMKNGASTTGGEGTPIGLVVFHRVPGGAWVVAASYDDGQLPPPDSYCRALVRQRAPASLRPDC